MCCLHFSLTDICVSCRAEEDAEVPQPPQGSLDVFKVDDSYDGLNAGLGCSTDVVGERTCDFDLETRNVADGKAKKTTDGHNGPKITVVQFTEMVNGGIFLLEKHDGNEKYRRVDVVVEHELPYIALHRW